MDDEKYMRCDKCQNLLVSSPVFLKADRDAPNIVIAQAVRCGWAACSRSLTIIASPAADNAGVTRQQIFALCKRVSGALSFWKRELEAGKPDGYPDQAESRYNSDLHIEPKSAWESDPELPL